MSTDYDKEGLRGASVASESGFSPKFQNGKEQHTGNIQRGC